MQEIDGQAAPSKSRGQRRGRGRGRGRGRAPSSKKADGKDEKAGSKAASSSDKCQIDSSTDPWTSFWTPEVEKEWYLWRGWSESDLRQWYGNGGEDVCPSQKDLKRRRVFCKSRPFDQASKEMVEEDEGAEEPCDAKAPGEEVDPEDPEHETCFARRPPPKKECTYMKWKSIKTAFMDNVALFVEYPSKYQDWEPPGFV